MNCPYTPADVLPTIGAQQAAPLRNTDNQGEYEVRPYGIRDGV